MASSAATPQVPTSTATPKLSVVRSISKNVDAQIAFCEVVDDQPQLIGSAAANQIVNKQLGGSLVAKAQQLGFTGKPGSLALLPSTPLVAVVGVESGNSPESLRRASGAATRAIVGTQADDKSVTIGVELAADDAEQVKACAEGIILGAYSYAKVSSTPKPAAVTAIEIASGISASQAKEAVRIATVIADNVLLARDWVNTPPNVLYPASFAEAASTALRAAKVNVEVLDDQALVAGGYGGIVAVGGGSNRLPRLLRAAHAPRGARFHLALVGKGITFDTGGLDLKSAEGMYTMKNDMSGAAAVIAATRAIAELGLAIKVTSYAAMAENMPSGSAYRPSDVLTMYGGMTVENVNSDAEGRLVMADALARASDDKPDLVIDVATLTGACVVALGLRVAGLMTSDDETAAMILDAAELTGEDFWQLPIPQHLRASLDSKVADLRSGGARHGGALTAAAFLQRFVGELPWAHLDIAGPAFNDEGPYDYVPTGGTGHAVRTLVALAASLAS